jgi:hypothetical protein
MTQDRYMSRGRVHTQVAELLDRTIRINFRKSAIGKGNERIGFHAISCSLSMYAILVMVQIPSR